MSQRSWVSQRTVDFQARAFEFRRGDVSFATKSSLRHDGMSRGSFECRHERIMFLGFQSGVVSPVGPEADTFSLAAWSPPTRRMVSPDSTATAARACDRGRHTKTAAPGHAVDGVLTFLMAGERAGAELGMSEARSGRHACTSSSVGGVRPGKGPVGAMAMGGAWQIGIALPATCLASAACFPRRRPWRGQAERPSKHTLGQTGRYGGVQRRNWGEIPSNPSGQQPLAGLSKPELAPHSHTHTCLRPAIATPLPLLCLPRCLCL